MLIVPIIALIFIGISYFFANRALPPNLAMKATGWMAGAAFVSYFATQVVGGVIAGLILREAVMEHIATLNIILIVLSIFGAIAGGALVLRGFVKRHRRRRAEKDAQAAAF